MRLLLCVSLLVSTLVMLGGCTWPSAPITAGLILGEKGPVAGFDTDAKATRVGRARAKGIIIVGYGDASITAAKLNGNITKIHHVDNESLNIFGIYSKYETIVYGE